MNLKFSAIHLIDNQILLKYNIYLGLKDERSRVKSER